MTIPAPFTGHRVGLGSHTRASVFATTLRSMGARAEVYGGDVLTDGGRDVIEAACAALWWTFEDCTEEGHGRKTG